MHNQPSCLPSHQTPLPAAPPCVVLLRIVPRVGCPAAPAAARRPSEQRPPTPPAAAGQAGRDGGYGEPGRGGAGEGDYSGCSIMTGDTTAAKAAAGAAPAAARSRGSSSCHCWCGHVAQGPRFGCCSFGCWWHTATWDWFVQCKQFKPLTSHRGIRPCWDDFMDLLKSWPVMPHLK